MRYFVQSIVIAVAALTASIVALPGAVGAGDGMAIAERDIPDASLAAVPAPAPTMDLTTGTCARWYSITSSDRHACDNILSNGNMTLDELRLINPSVNDNCSNLWVGYSYCIMVNREHTDVPAIPSKVEREYTDAQKAAVVAAGELRAWAEDKVGIEYNPDAPGWVPPHNNFPPPGHPTGIPTKEKRQAPQGPPSPALQKILDIASNLLANEIIGVFRNQNQARFFCNLVPVDRLNAQGLNGNLIKQDICDAGNQPLLTASQYQQNNIELSTDIFITQIIAGVVGKENHQTICDILDPAQLAMAGLDAGKVKQQVCAAAAN